MKHYTERIRSLREDRDLTQAALAEKLGMKQRTFSNYESGKTGMPTEFLMQLATFFHVSTDYLLGRTDDPTPPPPPRR